MVVPLKEISIVNLLKLNNPIIIDIRKSYDFSISHIPNSINIPYLDFIIEFPNYLDKNRIYYICCDEGEKGRELANYLNHKGYNSVNIIGGFKEYKNYKYKNL